jgi:hypothetical protein
MASVPLTWKLFTSLALDYSDQPSLLIVATSVLCFTWSGKRVKNVANTQAGFFVAERAIKM